MNPIRQLRPDELDESFALSQFAFQYELTPERLEQFKRRAKPEQTWGYFESGRLAAKLTVLPLAAFIQGKVFTMGGIAGVATWPEHRRKGLVARLLAHALRVMKDAGQTVSFLAPFSFAFYRKYGWETYVDYKQYTLELEHLPEFAGGWRFERRPGDWPLLNEIYEQYAVRYNGMLKRDKEWWEHRVFESKKGIAAVCYDGEGEPRGYLLYEVKEREMKIHEMVFLDETSRKAMWQFVRNHDSMIRKVSLVAPVDDPLPFLLPNPRFKQEIVPYFMARIVDVPAFLAQYPFAPSHPSESFVLRVDDPYAPWSEGTWLVTVDEQGRAAVEAAKAGSAPGSSSGVLRCDVQALSAMLMTYQTPSLLHDLGRLHGDENTLERWAARIPRRTTFLLDFF